MNKQITVNEYELDVRKEHRTSLKAYSGFLAAMVIAILIKHIAIENSQIILTLLSISIPSAIGSVNIERYTEFGKSNNPEWLFAASMFLIYVPSITAISILIAAASVCAGVTFAVMSVAWVVFIVKFRNVA